MLFFGPPGTGKTLLAKCIANTTNSNFIAVKGPELLSKFVGESEKQLREIFGQAKRLKPTLIFFDEIDSLFPKRGSSSSFSSATDKLVSQFISLLSEEEEGLIIIAATNRPDLLDQSLLVSGRFDLRVYLGTF